MAGPSSANSSSSSNCPSPGLWPPGVLRVRAWTAASSRRRSRSRAFRREAAISVSLRRRLTLRSASSSAARVLSSSGGLLRTASAVARHRSLQNSSRLTSPRLSASRWASVASSAPCAVPYARNSVAPSRIWCSSRASSPREQAATVALALPRASACSARASQATLRGSGGPRRRDLAACSRCGSAWVTLPRLSAIRPASRCACIASPARATSSRAVTSSTYLSKAGECSPPAYLASARTRPARVSQRERRCV